MTRASNSPIGAATAAVATVRKQVSVADRHLADALDHLEAAATVLDGLAAVRMEDARDVHQEDAGKE
jgi:hypothetical protein